MLVQAHLTHEKLLDLAIAVAGDCFFFHFSTVLPWNCDKAAGERLLKVPSRCAAALHQKKLQARVMGRMDHYL